MQVPSLEHNNVVKGESLDLVKFIDSNFEGPSLFPSVRFGDLYLTLSPSHERELILLRMQDPDKRQFAEELLSYTDSFNKGVITSFKADGMNDAGMANTC